MNSGHLHVSRAMNQRRKTTRLALVKEGRVGWSVKCTWSPVHESALSICRTVLPPSSSCIKWEVGFVETVIGLGYHLG